MTLNEVLRQVCASVDDSNASDARVLSSVYAVLAWLGENPEHSFTPQDFDGLTDTFFRTALTFYAKGIRDFCLGGDDT